MKDEYLILKTAAGSDYELIDSGEGEKLERFGEVVTHRPDPQALWLKKLPNEEWEKASAYFKRDSRDAVWSTRRKLKDHWLIEMEGLKFFIRLSAFKHVGIFPEHASNWSWIKEKISQRCHPCEDGDAEMAKVDSRLGNDSVVRVLNLFGYTGGATLAALAAGAEVCHVDGSKTAIGWAKENAEISGLSKKPVRWILDDAAKFVEREIKRGRKYDGIVLDPPAFGHGPKGELWKIEKSFLPLIENCQKILSDQPLFFLINGYSSGYSALAYRNNLRELENKFGGHVEAGELTIEETRSGRLLPAGIFARWSA